MIKNRQIALSAKGLTVAANVKDKIRFGEPQTAKYHFAEKVVDDVEIIF